MPITILTGGQTGVDQIAWALAAKHGLATAGWMPAGWLTEAGPRPDLAAIYHAQAHPSAVPADRTTANVRDADATLLFLHARSGRGNRRTLVECLKHAKPCWVVRLDLRPLVPSPHQISDRVCEFRVQRLNIAGDRASNLSPFTGDAMAYLESLMKSLSVAP
jgi:hypothetical protein